jgi:undecaprenyl-diphosphatase
MSEMDVRVLYWINSHRSEWLDRLLLPVALSGEVGFLMGLLFVAIFWVGSKQDWRGTLLLGFTLLALDRVIVTGLQLTMFRVRPYLALPNLVQGGLKWETSSFPSGHAHTAWLVTIVLGYRWPKALWFLIPYLLLTLYSRPYYAMHYPSDVLAGSLTGIALGVFIVALQRRRFPAKEERPGAPDGLPGRSS